MDTWGLQKKIHKAIKENLQVGITENELAKVITSLCPCWQGDILSGSRTSMIEGGPTDRVIRNGEVVLLDLQVLADSQWSDLTRVYFMGEATDKQRNAYNQVISAIKSGEKLLREGCKVNEIYHCMREAVGTEFAFLHHGGHVIGKDEIVTEPRFIPENCDTLKEGMIVTLEPAVYFPNEFGIRIENNYLITDCGFIRLCALSDSIDDYIQRG